MAVFDPTTLNLVLEGNKSAAMVRLDDGHPEELLETMGATIERAAILQRATSSDSHTVGPGPFVFTINEGDLGWKAGDFVVITDTTDPLANYMLCRLSADQDPSGDINVNVEYQVGSGLSTSWTIVLTVFILAATVAPPFTLAQGTAGSDMSTYAGAQVGRGNWSIAWTIPVRDFDVADPTATDAWNDGDLGHVAGAGTLGAFIGHEEAIFRRNSLGVFSFADPGSLRNGDVAYEGDYGVSGVYLERRYFNSDQAQWVQIERPQGVTHGGPLTGGANTISVTDALPRDLSFELSGAGAILTLPDPADWGSNLPRITVWSDDGNTKTLNVAGGLNINGITSLTFSGAYESRTVIVDSAGGEYIVVGSTP